VRNYEAQARAAGALGFYTDASGALMTVVPPELFNTFPMAALDGISVRAQSARMSGAEVANLLGRVADTWTGLPHGAGDSLVAYFDAELGRVLVTSTLPIETVQQALGAQGRAAAVAQFRYLQQTRNNDLSPFWGGAKVTLVGGQGGCTTAFVVKQSNGTRHMMVPAHCYSTTGVEVVTGAGVNLGLIGNVHFPPNPDMSWVSGQQYGASIYTGTTSGDASNQQVAGATDPVEGRAIYCRSGMVTFAHCSQTVESLTVMECLENHPCTSPNLIAYVDPNGSNTQPGDSGAPFYLTSNGSAYIRGMHIGINLSTSGLCKIDVNPCSVPHDQMIADRWTVIASTMGVTIVP
jgi:hypothetical protein